jgi:fructokinase
MGFGYPENAMRERKRIDKPRLITAGFLALDVVFGLEDSQPRIYAGATSGNVAAGLAFLGWDVTALARLDEAAAGCFVRSDLEHWGVKTQYLGLAPTAPTPIVLERIERSKNGTPKHRFLWNCPDCGAFFPPYRALLQTQVPFFEENCRNADVFFTDRVSRSTVELARDFRSKGAIVYFEPSGAGDAKLFREMLEHCTILKYSAQRAPSFSDLLRNHDALLEIETLGEDGLHFRTRQNFRSWHTLPAHEVPVKDTAGSGDWTTIGLLSALSQKGISSVASATRSDISAAIEHGQAMAALNCKFEGPRGIMYKLTRSAFLEAVRTIEDRRPHSVKEHAISLSQDMSTSLLCPSCIPKSSSQEHRLPRTTSSKVEASSRAESVHTRP